LQQRRPLKTIFCEILGAAQFSTFSTVSVKGRRAYQFGAGLGCHPLVPRPYVLSLKRRLTLDVTPWREDRRAHLRAELDAFYARAYGLDRDELRYILDPADVKGEGYPSETFRVLKDKEIRAYNEFRTHRLVLEAWDRTEADGTFKALGM
jgi:hypothetical protein